MRTAKTLIRLGGCPGWSESSLGAQPLCWFCHVEAQISGIKVKVLKGCDVKRYVEKFFWLVNRFWRVTLKHKLITHSFLHHGIKKCQTYKNTNLLHVFRRHEKYFVEVMVKCGGKHTHTHTKKKTVTWITFWANSRNFQYSYSDFFVNFCSEKKVYYEAKHCRGTKE